MTPLQKLLILSLCLATTATQAAELERKRALSPGELAGSLSSVLDVSLLGLEFNKLGRLPVTYRQGDTIPEAWQSLIATACARIFDARPQRPATASWLLDFGAAASDQTSSGLSILQAGHGSDPAVIRSNDIIVQRSDASTALIHGQNTSTSKEQQTSTITIKLTPHNAGLWRFNFRLSLAPSKTASPHGSAGIIIRHGTHKKRVDIRRTDWHELECQLALPGNETVTMHIETGDQDPAVAIDSLSIEGPIFDFTSWPPPSHRRVLFDSILAGTGTAYRQAVIDRLLRRSFRRPPTSAERRHFLAHYEQGIKAGSDELLALQNTITRILTDPRFLWIEDHSGQADGQRRMCDAYECAARWSYALHGAPPSDSWLEMAAAGTLLDKLPALLTSSQARGFGNRLAEHWFNLQELQALPVDSSRYPTWNRLHPELRKEVGRFLDSHVVSSRMHASALVTANTLSLNKSLAIHYELYGPKDSSFLRTPIKGGHGRCGLPSMGALLALSCGGKESNINKRGQAMWNMLLRLGNETAPAEQLAQLDKLLSVYDVIGRRTDAPKPGWSNKALVTFFKKHRKRMVMVAGERIATYVVGYPLQSDDQALAEALQEYEKNVHATDDLLGLLKRWLAHPRSREKW